MTPSARGITMSKVTHMRQALHQICADEDNPLTLTAQILREHDVTRRDVMVACDVVADVVADGINRNQAAANALR